MSFCLEESSSFTVPFSYVDVYRCLAPEKALKRDAVTKSFIPEVFPVGTKMSRLKSWWSVEQETEVMRLGISLMAHPNCLHIGQGYGYDISWYYKWWKLRCWGHFDPLIATHAMNNKAQKKLDFQASLHCPDYVPWKSERTETPDQRLVYCGKDSCYTMTLARKPASLPKWWNMIFIARNMIFVLCDHAF